MDSTIPEATRTLPRLSLTAEEAADATGFSRTRIYQAIRAGELMARKSGRCTVLEVDELARWLRSLPTRGRKPDDVDATAA